MNKLIERICSGFVTLGPIGYTTASGTVATVCTVPLIIGLREIMPNQWVYAGLIIILFLLSLGAVKLVHQTFFHENDPSQIVVDEMIGCMITFWGIPVTPIYLLCGFLLFRFFDISKCAGISRLEKIHGAWGIMLDDVLAGIWSNILLRILLFWQATHLLN